MKEYKVLIREVLEREVTVKTNTLAESLDTVKEMHRNEEIVLDADDFSDVSFTVI
jgi:hypothetical protein